MREKAIEQRMRDAVLERVTPAIENDMPMLRAETVLSHTDTRMVRVSHPTYMDEDAYVLVTAMVITKEQANRLMRGEPWALVQDAAPSMEPELGFQKEIAQAKADLNVLGEPHVKHVTGCCQFCRLASKYKTGCEDPNCQCHTDKPRPTAELPAPGGVSPANEEWVEKARAKASQEYDAMRANDK